MSENNEPSTGTGAPAAKKSGLGSQILGWIILIAIIGGVWQCFQGGSNEIKVVDGVAYVDRTYPINLGDAGALSSITYQTAQTVYNIAKDAKVQKVQVTIYFNDLSDKYGKKIEPKDAKNGTFEIDNLDEVRKYNSASDYAIADETKIVYAMWIVTNGNYSHLWKM